MNRRNILISKALLFILTFALAFAIFKCAASIDSFRDPDVLYMEHLYIDVFQNGNNISFWALPNAPFYIDTIIYAAIRPFAHDVFSGMSLHAAVTITFLSCILSMFCTQISKTTSQTILLPAIPPLILLLLLGSPPIPPSINIAFMPAFHFITLIATALVNVLLLKIFAKPNNRFLIALLAAIAVAASTSDPLFILWSTIPATFVVIFASSTTIQLRQKFALVIILFAMSMTGLAFGSFLRPIPLTQLQGIVNINPSKSLSAAVTFFSNFISLLSHATLQEAIIIITGTAGIACAIYTSFTNRKITSLILSISFVCTLFGVLLNGKTEYRYLAPIYFFPPTIGFAYIIKIITSSSRLSLRPTQSTLALLTLTSIAVFHAATQPSTSHSQADVLDIAIHELATSGLTRGAATYQYARRIQFFPDSNVEIAPVIHSARPYRLVTTQQIFENPVHFFVCAYTENTQVLLDERDIISINGEPSTRVVLPGYTLLTYPQGARLAGINDTFGAHGPLARRSSQPDTILWNGNLQLYPGLQLNTVRFARREYDTVYAVLEFSGDYNSLLGKTIGVECIGDRSPSHKKKAAGLISPTASSFGDTLLRNFLHRRYVKADTYNTEQTTCINILMAFPLPNRENTVLTTLIVTVDGTPYRLF